MILFIPSLSRILKSPRYYMLGLGLTCVILAIGFTVLFSSEYSALQPRPAVCSLFGASTLHRICSDADCQLSQSFNVKNYKLPTIAQIHNLQIMKDQRVRMMEMNEKCVGGESVCYEPGWLVNSNINQHVRRISSRMVTVNPDQALYLTQLLTNSTADTFWNCFERFNLVHWYFSDFTIYVPTTYLVIFCIFYPIGLSLMLASVIWWSILGIKHLRNKKNAESETETKPTESQPLVINSQPNSTTSV